MMAPRQLLEGRWAQVAVAVLGAGLVLACGSDGGTGPSVSDTNTGGSADATVDVDDAAGSFDASALADASPADDTPVIATDVPDVGASDVGGSDVADSLLADTTDVMVAPDTQPDGDGSVVDWMPPTLPAGLTGQPVDGFPVLAEFDGVQDTEKTPVGTTDLLGKWTVLWFYPKANTFG